MSYSYAESARGVCPRCGQASLTEVLLIVDLDARPDLAESVIKDILHSFTCSHCGLQGRLDAPLLLYHPDMAPPLIFIPQANATSEENEKHANRLLGRLREHLRWRHRQKGDPAICRENRGALGRTRTCDLLIRSQLTYVPVVPQGAP